MEFAIAIVIAKMFNSDCAIGCNVSVELQRAIDQRSEDPKSAITTKWRSDTQESL